MPGSRLRSSIESILRPPYLASILAGFLVSYVSFFLLPVFLSPGGMQFYQYIPAIAPGGVDLKQVLNAAKEWLGGGSPYFQYNLYPPLTYVLVSPLLLIPYDLRYRLATFATLIAYSLLSLFIPLALGGMRKAWGILIFVFLTGLFSYGFQFEIERGQFNVLAVCLAFLAIWIFHKHPHFRPAAYFLLSLSVQLKLYPLIFVVTLVDDWRDWRSTIRRFALFCGVNLALLFVLGTSIFVEFIRAIEIQTQNRDWIWIGDHSIHSFLALLVSRLVQRGWDWMVPYQDWLQIGGSVLIAACIALIGWKGYRERQNGSEPHLLMACAIGASILPAISNDYELSILVAPVAILLGRLAADSAQSDLPIPRSRLTALLISIFSLAYSSILFSYVQKPATILLANAFPALLVMLFTVTGLALTRPQPDGALPELESLHPQPSPAATHG